MPVAEPVIEDAVAAVPAPPQLNEITLDAPEAGLDFSALLAHYRGRMADEATLDQLTADLRDAYDWADWREISVNLQADATQPQHWQARITALPPDRVPAPPAAFVVPAPPPASARVMPAGARAETNLDARFDAWKNSQHRILVVASEHRLYFKRASGQVVSYPVALGTARTPTPLRDYRIESVSHKPTWYPPASIRREHRAQGKTLPAFVPPGVNNPLGSYFVRLQDSIGIHGTNQPRSIGRPASHGCIRMHDRDVRELAPQLKAGDGVSVVNALPAPTTQQVAP